MIIFRENLHEEIIKRFQQNKKIIISGISNITSKTFLISDFLEKIKNKIIFVVNKNTDVIEIKNNILFWKNIYTFSFSGILQQEEEKKQKTIIEGMSFLNKKNKGIFFIKKDDLKINVPSISYLKEKSLNIKKGDDFRNVEIFNTLIKLGYKISYDPILKKGEYRRSGCVLDLFPINLNTPVKIEIEYEKISNIWKYFQEGKKLGKKKDKIQIFPMYFSANNTCFSDIVDDSAVFIFDDIEDINGDFRALIENKKNPTIIFTSFPKDNQKHIHMRYLSVLKFYNIFDLINDLKDKISQKWDITIITKRKKEIEEILKEEKIKFIETNLQDAFLVKTKNTISIIDAPETGYTPSSFQNPQYKILFLTDREIFNIKRTAKNKTLQRIDLDFLTSLKAGDFIVHLDHGIGRFLGVVQKSVEDVTKEYLEIAYAENDKLFIPVDQADKISKFIRGENETEPKLSRLGSQEWKNINYKVKKEAQKIAKELLALYAKRAQTKGFIYNPDNEKQKQFEKNFPYEETPGQIKAIVDIKNDMEKNIAMDRLICGDVGFGKTEVAMRAAFKAVMNKKQVAFISPITILTDQHYRTMKKRMDKFNIRIEMLSRFRSPLQQREIIQKLAKGKIDIVVGTHRLLQEDIKFKNLGLVIIDEEQRFGVKQKEKLKQMRTSVDILTLTATPIPRTLNLGLNKLRDITTITTPPPGRLPVITEVRKYSDRLVRDAILNEIKRQGQIYFLHNRVETIESVANKLRILVPEAKFIVAHGQLQSQDLEDRIIAFKNYQYDVLVSSTIIENGIDLPNANTLIVNDAEEFGLSQLYQLRGRIGRGKVQAYAYFLYHSQRLREDAKKRLRAIVEASELGSGFQIAMKDLEIRGAGDILGVNQHGSVKTVGVSHFIRMLNKTVEEMKAGKSDNDIDKQTEITIEIPLEGYIPNSYIPDNRDKVNIYQKLSAIDNLSLLAEFYKDLQDEYGEMPNKVKNLFKVLEIKLLARKAGIVNIKSEITRNKGKEIQLTISNKITAEHIVKLLQHNSKWQISGMKLKIDIKNLGFNWVEGLKENIKQLM